MLNRSTAGQQRGGGRVMSLYIYYSLHDRYSHTAPFSCANLPHLSQHTYMRLSPLHPKFALIGPTLFCPPAAESRSTAVSAGGGEISSTEDRGYLISHVLASAGGSGSKKERFNFQLPTVPKIYGTFFSRGKINARSTPQSVCLAP